MICKKCNRVKLRAEEEITVKVQLGLKRVDGNSNWTAVEDSHREHVCRPLNLSLNEGLALLMRGRYGE